uniref:Uncharacterized protein n=1 Tax=Glossina pallidipes TaxID=7398 RepID=A0A1A9ZT96_GLOPL
MKTTRNAANTAKISRNIIRGQRRQRYVTTCPTNKDMSKAPVKFHFYLLLVMALAQVMDIVDTCTIIVILTDRKILVTFKARQTQYSNQALPLPTERTHRSYPTTLCHKLSRLESLERCV